MLLQVSGKDGLDDQEAKALELYMVQVGQEVVLGLGQVEAPSGGSVVILQDRAVIVQDRLWTEEQKTEEQKNWHKYL